MIVDKVLHSIQLEPCLVSDSKSGSIDTVIDIISEPLHVCQSAHFKWYDNVWNIFWGQACLADHAPSIQEQEQQPICLESFYICDG